MSYSLYHSLFLSSLKPNNLHIFNLLTPLIIIIILALSHKIYISLEKCCKSNWKIRYLYTWRQLFTKL